MNDRYPLYQNALMSDGCCSESLRLTFCCRDPRKDGSTFAAETASGNFPQVAEFNTSRSMGATGEYSAYDGFKACKIHTAAPAQQSCGQLYEKSKVNNEISGAILWTSGSLSQARNTFACDQICAYQGHHLLNIRSLPSAASVRSFRTLEKLQRKGLKNVIQ